MSQLVDDYRLEHFMYGRRPAIHAVVVFAEQIATGSRQPGDCRHAVRQRIFGYNVTSSKGFGLVFTRDSML